MSFVWGKKSPLLDSRAPSGATRCTSHWQIMQEIIFGLGQWMACILSLRACLWQYIRPPLDFGPIQSYPGPRPEHTNVRKLTLLSLNFCNPDGRVIKVAWIKGEMQQFSSQWSLHTAHGTQRAWFLVIWILGLTLITCITVGTVNLRYLGEKEDKEFSFNGLICQIVWFFKSR